MLQAAEAALVLSTGTPLLLDPSRVLKIRYVGRDTWALPHPRPLLASKMRVYGKPLSISIRLAVDFASLSDVDLMY
jgi:hypothetical protein